MYFREVSIHNNGLRLRSALLHSPLHLELRLLSQSSPRVSANQGSNWTKSLPSDSTSRLFNSEYTPQPIHAGFTSSRSHSFFSFLGAIVGREEVDDRPAVKPDQGFLPGSTSTAMACCPKEYAEECEILVCVDAPVPYDSDLYSRLRFGLLASSWLPSPLGVFLWSALHVMLLIVDGPVIWVLGLLAAFIFYSIYVFFQAAVVYVFMFMVAGVIAVAVDLIFLLGRSIRFCWSLVEFLACNKRIVSWRGDACLTVQLWKNFMPGMRKLFWDVVPFGVPCMSGSFYEETKNQMLRTWARWCGEVVHMHEAIAL